MGIRIESKITSSQENHNEKGMQKLQDRDKPDKRLKDVKNKSVEDLVVNEENKKSIQENNRKLPDWYQELSHAQKMFIESLQSIIICDIEEGIVARTSRVIAGIGIFPRPTRSKIKEALDLSDKNSLMFLLHLYRLMRSEKYMVHCSGKARDYYTVNERLILSGITCLSYYWTILDLERRIFRSPLPEELIDAHDMICTAYTSIRKKKKIHYSSPYQEPHPFLSLHAKKSSIQKVVTKQETKTQHVNENNQLLCTNQIERKRSAHEGWQLVKLVPEVTTYTEYWEQFFGKYRHTKINTSDSSENVVGKIDSKENLTEQVKYQLQIMAEEGNPLAALPQVHQVPCIRMWIKYHEGFRLTKVIKDKFLRQSSLECSFLQFHPCRVYVRNPFKFDKVITWKNIYSIREKAENITNKYQREVRTAQVDDARFFWLPMYAEYFPNPRFLDIFYAYLPSKEEDVLTNPGI